MLVKQLAELSHRNQNLQTSNDVRLKVPTTFSLAFILLGVWEEMDRHWSLPHCWSYYDNLFWRMESFRLTEGIPRTTW